MPLTGGTFTGPELSGKLIPGASADWQTVLPDGTAPGDIRYSLRTDGGGLLYVCTSNHAVCVTAPLRSSPVSAVART